jgi:hypothetical protein
MLPAQYDVTFNLVILNEVKDLRFFAALRMTERALCMTLVRSERRFYRMPSESGRELEKKAKNAATAH